MEGRFDRPVEAERKNRATPGEKRRPYAPPSVQVFGRKLPAFAPPSPPQRNQPPWNNERGSSRVRANPWSEPMTRGAQCVVVSTARLVPRPCRASIVPP